MKVRVLESARKDLVDGFYFYEKQADGIGTYFLEANPPEAAFTAILSKNPYFID